MSKTTSSGGTSIATVLFIVFLVLKLVGTIDWSWWWVTAPIWGTIVFWMGVVIVIGVIKAIVDSMN